MDFPFTVKAFVRRWAPFLHDVNVAFPEERVDHIIRRHGWKGSGGCFHQQLVDTKLSPEFQILVKATIK